MRAGRFHEHMARRRELLQQAQARVPPQIPVPAPPPRIPPPQAAHARVAAMQNAPPPLPGPAPGARQDLAMDQAYIWRQGGPAGQIQPPAPAVAPVQVFGPAPAPRPDAGYGMGHMMQFAPFRHGALNQAMDQALAHLGPAFRRSMPPHNYLDDRVPHDVANLDRYRPARVAPEARPVNLLNDPFQHGQNFGGFQFPLPGFPEQAPLAGHNRLQRLGTVAPNNPGADHRPNPPSPPPEQGRGNQDDPIVLSSPIRPDLVDLTIEDNMEAANKLWDMEDGHLWPNILDLDRQWPIDVDGVD